MHLSTLYLSIKACFLYYQKVQLVPKSWYRCQYNIGNSYSKYWYRTRPKPIPRQKHNKNEELSRVAVFLYRFRKIFAFFYRIFAFNFLRKFGFLPVRPFDKRHQEAALFLSKLQKWLRACPVILQEKLNSSLKKSSAFPECCQSVFLQ